MDDYGSKVIKGAGTIFLVMAASSLLAYLLRLVLARKLSQDEFGLFFAVYSVVLLIGWIKNFGIPSTVQKFIAEFKIKGQQEQIRALIAGALKLTLLSGTVFLVVGYFLPDSLVNGYFQSSNGNLLFLVLLVSIGIDAISFIIGGYFLATNRYLLYASKDFLIRLVVLLGVIFLPISVVGIGWMYVAAVSVVALFNIFYFLRLFPFFTYHTKLTLELRKRMLAFSAPLVVRDFVGVLMSYVDTIALVFFRPLKEVAIYNVILPTADLLLLFGRPFGRVMFPLSAELWALDKKEKIASLLKQIHQNLFLFLMPLYVGIFLFAEFILTNLFGSNYSEGILGLRLLALGFIISSLNISCYDVVVGIGKTREATRAILWSNLVNVVLNILLIPFFGRVEQGYLGAIIGTVIGSSLLFLFFLSTLRKNIAYHLPLRAWSLGCFSALFLLGIGLYIVRSDFSIYLQIGIMISLVLVLYLPLLFFFRVTSIGELQGLYHSFFGKKKEDNEP